MDLTQSDIIIVVFAVTVVILLLATFGITFTLIYKKKQQANKKEKQTIQSQFNETLLQTQLEIQEQTLQNISQEIHDNIGQTLSFIKLNMNMINLDKREAAEDKLGESNVLLTKAIQDLRDLSKILNTDFISETGLVHAIELQLTILKKTELYTTRLDVTGSKEKYQLQSELVTFRVVQECLNNIVKHAEATDIRVTMDYGFGKLMITVCDNGRGFSVDLANDGMGLRNMRSRLLLMLGSIKIESTPGKGTIVYIELPKQKEMQYGNI